MAPAKAAMVMVSTELTAAMRMPDMMYGMAMGSSTRRSCCIRVRPMPRATSMETGEMPEMPVYVFFKMGRNA